MHALVMTSGNLSEEPIETDDDLAWEHLVAAGIADALLGNDRAILSRYDDSVVRVVDGAVMPVRRARGYAPQPIINRNKNTSICSNRFAIKLFFITPAAAVAGARRRSVLRARLRATTKGHDFAHA